MSFSDYQRLARATMEDRKQRYQGFIHNPTFRRYCQIHNLKPNDREAQEKFLMTPQGWRLALKLGLGLDKPPVKVIPHQKTRRVGRLGLDISTHLEDGHILALSLDLSARKTHLLAGISFMILRYQRHVSSRRERLSPLALLPGVLSSERWDRRFMLVDLDLHASPEKIRYEVGRLLPARPVRGPKRGRRQPYPRKVCLWDVWQAYDEHKTFRRGSWSLGVPEDTFRRAYYRAFALVTGEVYRPGKHTPAGLPLFGGCASCPNRPTCTVLCPEALAFVNQDYRAIREKLAAIPAFF